MNTSARTFLLLMFGAVAIAGSPGPGRAQNQDIPHPTLPRCQQDDPALLLPDLVPDEPTDVRNDTQASRRMIRFTTAISNSGDGPLVIEGRTISTPEEVFTQGYQVIWRRDGSKCARATGRFEYHPTHRHFHFERFVGYELRTDDPITGALATVGDKASFCLLDIEMLRGYRSNLYPRQVTNLTCDDQEGIQGISVGWKDVYERILPGQSIGLDIDRSSQVPVGSYFLINRVDPDGLLWEKNKDNNLSSTVVRVNLPPPDLSLLPPPATPRTQRPHIRPGHSRPPRVARSRPTRVQPSRPSRNTPTPTPTTPLQATGCEDACSYGISQARLTWYAGRGLNISAFIQNRGCPALQPALGENGTVRMVNWLTESRQNTGLEHTATYVIDDGSLGAVSNGGTIQFSPQHTGASFTYDAPVPPIASYVDRKGFPVVFDLCVTLGSKKVKARLVCQAKRTGMLCHEG